MLYLILNYVSSPIFCKIECKTAITDMKFLTANQKSFYSENGYIKLENVFSDDEINHMSKEYDDLFQVGT